ncbi:hypothetical protein GCM10018790_64310 [Kitasatospora xanthocidica]|uniref:hypothetical protein n=1 Tax=Kitasatospora xanthocidica TaxID=83382 RepID=UPI00167A827E|nr:hypothetical protein [Kitasatospora xanthocidica]GHF77343.1 hypothetical protein GCM10018790_64310 [Kitasatospora xanthocidica]
MRVVLQPAGRSKKVINQHYLDTIASPVVFDDHADLLEPGVRERLDQLFPGGSAQMWGVVPGVGDANVHWVEKMSPGDFALFSGDKKIYFGGTIALMWRNEGLAGRLWGRKDNGQTWEYMYALSGTQGFDVTVDEIRRLLDWKPKRNIQGVYVLDQDDSDTLQAHLTLEASTADTACGPPPDPQADADAATGYDGELERTATRAYRGEQAALKRHLLPGPTGECALCGRTLPAGFLIAAHIKKRAVCTDDEKRDFQNIAMLACSLGCDSLYERGYITVTDTGHIRISPLAHTMPGVHDHIRQHLADRTVPWWTQAREPHFHWHRTHTFKPDPPA